jgi:hypothetical protein
MADGQHEAVTVVLKRVGEPARVAEIAGETVWEAMRAAVGAEVLELLPVGPDVVAVLDEEGMYADKPFNACGILGDFLVVAEEDDGFRSLTPGEARKALAWCAKYNDLPHGGFAVGVVGLDSTADFLAHLGRARDAIRADWESL